MKEEDYRERARLRELVAAGTPLTSYELAKHILYQLIAEMKGRQGLDVFHSFDTETWIEMREAWIEIIEKGMGYPNA